MLPHPPSARSPTVLRSSALRLMNSVRFPASRDGPERKTDGGRGRTPSVPDTLFASGACEKVSGTELSFRSAASPNDLKNTGGPVGGVERIYHDRNPNRSRNRNRNRNRSSLFRRRLSLREERLQGRAGNPSWNPGRAAPWMGSFEPRSEYEGVSSLGARIRTARGRGTPVPPLLLEGSSRPSPRSAGEDALGP